MRTGLMLIVLLVVAAACHASGGPLEVTVPCDWFERGSTPIALGWGQIEPDLDDEFTVSLCSNPSTGYSWSDEVAYDRTILQLVDREFVPRAASSPPVVGAGGSEVMLFRVVGRGTTTIEATYRRPFEARAQPLWTFDLDVLVD